MLEQYLTGNETDFLIKLAIATVAGVSIGVERESRGKVAGTSTHTLVIAGSMLFTMLSLAMNPQVPSQIAAAIVTGIGFLGAGIILKEGDGKIINVTTAASIWFAAGIGIAIGFNWYGIALISTVFSVLTPRIHHYLGANKST